MLLDLQGRPAFLFQVIVLEFMLFLGYSILMIGPIAVISWFIPCQCCGNKDINAYEYCRCDRALPYQSISFRTLLWPWRKFNKLTPSMVCRGFCS